MMPGDHDALFTDFQPSMEEVAAFHKGIEDGEKIGGKPMNPYQDRAQAEAWETGYSVGTCNRQMYPR